MEEHKKLSDEAKAGILMGIWEISMWIAMLKNTAVWWVVFGFVTLISLLVIYFDQRNERANKRAEDSHRKFVEQTTRYLNNIMSTKN